MNFWVGELDAKQVNRGRVMTQFSESNEFKTASRGKVIAADLWDAMLGVSIPSSTLILLGGQIQGGGTAGYTGTLHHRPARLHRLNRWSTPRR